VLWARIPRVAPLSVDPEALFAAGSAVVAAGGGVAATLAVLTSGFGANTGQDAAGLMFGLAYQQAARSLLKAAAAGINACRYNGAQIQLSASNYSKAEAASTLGGGGNALSAPSQPETFAAPRPPRTLGPGMPAPLLWVVVEAFLEEVWPNGDAAALRAAAGSWRTFGAALGGMKGALDASKSLVGTQQIVEGEKIQQVLSGISTKAAALGMLCGKLAASLDDFAGEVAHAQNAIRDLLHRLASVSGLWNEVVSVFDGDALEEIKKIAADINAVLHNMKREAQSRAQVINKAMQVIDGWVREMEKYTRAEFTHFLGDEVGNPVATVFDTFVNTEEGVLKGVTGLTQLQDQLDPLRLAYDPQGVAADVKGMARTFLISGLFDPQGAVKADEEMLKSSLHVQDWRGDRPGLGFGEVFFDAATLVAPGLGEVGAGAKGARAAAGGVKGAA
jgi:hypothetical protein